MISIISKIRRLALFTSFARGQLMVIIVLIMASIFSVALVQASSFVNAVRQARLVMDSAKAFYAADSGVELALYRYFKNAPGEQVTMTNGTFCCTLEVIQPAGAGQTLEIKSTGTSPEPAGAYKVVRSIESQGF